MGNKGEAVTVIAIVVGVTALAVVGFFGFAWDALNQLAGK